MYGLLCSRWTVNWFSVFRLEGIWQSLIELDLEGNLVSQGFSCLGRRTVLFVCYASVFTLRLSCGYGMHVWARNKFSLISFFLLPSIRSSVSGSMLDWFFFCTVRVGWGTNWRVRSIACDVSANLLLRYSPDPQIKCHWRIWTLSIDWMISVVCWMTNSQII